MLKEEREYITTEVRPKLDLVAVAWSNYGQADLKIDVISEGRKRLEDVKLIFDAGAQGGLEPPGILHVEKNLSAFPLPVGNVSFHLRGDLQKGQTRVKVAAKILARGGYDRTTTWELDLERFLKTGKKHLPLHTLLPRCFEYAVEKVEIPNRKGLHMIVLDDMVDQRKFAQTWCDLNAGLHVDLDNLLRDLGPGRRYSNHAMDDIYALEKIGTHVENSLRERGLPFDGTPVCLSPLGSFYNRCLEYKKDTVIRSMTASLLSKENPSHNRPWILIVDSLLARILCKWKLPGIEEYVVHLALKVEYERTLEEENSPGKELAQIISENFEERPKAGLTLAHLIRDFNADIRLILLWLHWKKRPVNHGKTHRAFFKEKETKDLLLNEMSIFSSQELLGIMVGSVGLCRIEIKGLKVGMYAGENVYSTVYAGGAIPKRILQKGLPVDSRALSAVRSRGGLDTVTVEGYIMGRSTDDRKNLRLLLKAVQSQDQNQLFGGLRDKGFADWDGHCFRTRSPYKDVIRDLYAESPEEDKHKDTAVYQAIFGKRRFPLESMTLSDLDKLGPLLSQVMGKATNEDLNKLKQLALLWEEPGTPDLEQRICRILKLNPSQNVQSSFEHLKRIPFPVFIKDFHRQAGSFWVWVDQRKKIKLDEIVDSCQKSLQNWYKNRINETEAEQIETRSPQIILFGPGIETAVEDSEYRAAYLKQSDFLQNAWEGDLLSGLNRTAQKQMRLTSISPFKFTGPLPPGSPLFKGRAIELEYLKSNIRRVSVLVVGSRRVGKTSFLYELLHWARREPGLCPIFVDTQNCSDLDSWQKALRDAVQEEYNAHLSKLSFYNEMQLANGCFENMVRIVREHNYLPIFLLNEVDRIAKSASTLVDQWRRSNELNEARFVMIGYASLRLLGDPESPFYHFTQGLAFDNKAITLTALSEHAANDLLELLMSKNLGLEWAISSERQKAFDLCRKRSYCIPWVLQRFGHLILKKLEERRENILSYDLVFDALHSGGDVVWRYITSIDYERLGYEGSVKPYRSGFKLLIYILARSRYFLGKPAPILDTDISKRSPLERELSFSINEARDAVDEIMDQVLFLDEFKLVKNWFYDLDLTQVLSLLTLTLVLEPDPNDGERFGFMMHIFPLELWRRSNQKEGDLDGLIVGEADTFLKSLKHDEERNK